MSRQHLLIGIKGGQYYLYEKTVIKGGKAAEKKVTIARGKSPSSGTSLSDHASPGSCSRWGVTQTVVYTGGKRIKGGAADYPWRDKMKRGEKAVSSTKKERGVLPYTTGVHETRLVH